MPRPFSSRVRTGRYPALFAISSDIDHCLFPKYYLKNQDFLSIHALQVRLLTRMFA